MSPGLFLAIALAGGVGASVRLLLDDLIKVRMSGSIPWATMIINVSGSLVLGFITGLATARLLPEAWHLVIGAGFLGGYTTFSTASFETIRLLREGRWALGAFQSLGTLIVATSAAGLGLWLGGLVR